MAETLYELKDIAAVFGVGPSAVSNWYRRKTGPYIPDPAYRTRSGKLLFSEDQMQEIVANQAMRAKTLLRK